MLVMDLATGNLRQADILFSVNAYCRYCLLTPSIKEMTVLTINVHTLEIEHIAGLNNEYKHSGIIAVNHMAFVFGGRTVHCERLDTDMTWANLPDMSALRCGFYPCLHK